ncbi:lipopolysaccharide biosynthesis protein [Photobacterium leiognathi]|uniref:lipopolysaccharide biosynthesis protein n=1 Tax=Photobacterium leiognathi TaxID=553611 RepID=UPI0029824CD4|nr:oligosaccharide flippase family protein [Photobacterium leiognathi]
MSNVIKSASIYLSSNILNAAIPFIFLPILTRYLTQGEYGQIAMFQMLLNGLLTIIGLGVQGSATRKYYDVNISERELSFFNGSCLQISFYCFTFILCSFYFLGELLSKYLSIPLSWCYIAVCISLSTFIIQLRLAQWQVRGEAKKYGLLVVIQSLLNFSLSLIFVIKLDMGAYGRIDAQFITAIIFILISLFFLYRDKLIILFIFNIRYIKEALKFGLPLVPHAIGTFILTSFDRFIINKHLGIDSAGVYMVALQISMGFIIIFDSINKAYCPWLFSKLKNDDKKENIKIVKTTYVFIILALFVGIAAYYISPFIVIIIAGEKYIQASDIIGWLCLGQIFSGMYLIFTNYIFFAKKTILLSIISIISGVVSIFILLFLVRIYALEGAAISFAIGQLLQFSLTVIAAIKVHKMPWLGVKL